MHKMMGMKVLVAKLIGPRRPRGGAHRAHVIPETVSAYEKLQELIARSSV